VFCGPRGTARHVTLSHKVICGPRGIVKQITMNHKVFCGPRGTARQVTPLSSLMFLLPLLFPCPLLFYPTSLQPWWWAHHVMTLGNHHYHHDDHHHHRTLLKEKPAAHVEVSLGRESQMQLVACSFRVIWSGEVKNTLQI
jgi:hypothetical protein